MTPKGGRHYERWVPGVHVARTYERRWLRADLVAGIVLAAILVPQGMAYAELAGLPAVTGLYTTIACLVAYAIFGPSRVLVLGPDSAVSPLIFAAIVPLLAGGDPATAIALAGMLALLVGADRDRPRAGQARLRRRPAVEGGPGRLHERPRHHHHRRPAAQAVRLLDRCRQLHRRAEGVLRRPGQDERDDARRRRRLSARPARAAAAHSPDPGGARRRRRRHGRVRRPRPCRARREDRRRPAPRRAYAGLPLDQLRRHRPAAHRRRRHHSGIADRHHRHRHELRRPAGRRGRAGPGDDGDRRGEHRRGVLPGLRRLDERLAHGGGRSSRAPRARSPASWAPASSPSSCSSSTVCSRICRKRRWPPWSSSPPSRSWTSASSPATTGSARPRWRSRWSRPAA